ncbi:MAG: hypothetical protein OEY34_04170 [Cyclobacteriaceae bacterium]|nr:hypothetical protein [Cyclobacteriaceae bacterium]
MKSKIILTLFILLVFSCHSLQKTNPMTEAVKYSLKEAKAEADRKGDRQTSVAIKSCILSLDAMEQENRDIKNENRDLRKQLAQEREEKAQISRQAGKGDQVENQMNWILYIAGILLLFFFLYLILKGKIRIPGIIG